MRFSDSNSLWITLAQYLNESVEVYLPFSAIQTIYYDLKGRVAPLQRTYKNWKAEQADKAAKRAAEKERKAERVMREKAEKARREDIDRAVKSGIMSTSKAKEEMQVHLVGKINREIYKCITSNIVTDEVIITDERIMHIKERHPDDYERFYSYIPAIIDSPDYIIEANKPNTAVILKEIKENGEKFKLVLRIKVESDPDGYKNSIMTFWHIGEMTWKKSLKNKNILYKRE